MKGECTVPPGLDTSSYLPQSRESKYVTLFGKRGIKVNLENVLTRLIGFVEKRGNPFCMRILYAFKQIFNAFKQPALLHFNIAFRMMESKLI